MSRRILVTGGSGFLGCRILPGLVARGLEVHAAGRRPPDCPGVIHHAADLLLPGEAERVARAAAPDILLHAAWMVEHGRFWSAPDNLDWTAATLRLARAAASAGASRIVGVGTCAEYDWTHAPGLPRREADPVAAVSLYAEAKLATVRLLGRWAAGQSISFAWARLFFPFGPGEPAAKLVSSVTMALARGESVAIRGAPLVRDFVDVSDAGDAIAALASSSAEGVVNVGSGEAVPVGTLAGLIQASVGGGSLVLADVPPPGEPAVMSADLARLRHEVGVPPPPPLALRVAETVRQLLAGAPGTLPKR